LALCAALAISFLAPPAIAVDMTGKTIRAEGLVKRKGYNGTNKDFTYPLLIYFGAKGNRFVKMKFTTMDDRVLVAAGGDKGFVTSRGGNYKNFVTISQTPSSLHIVYESRGATSAYANEKWVYDITLGNGSCTITSFKYTADPRAGFTGLRTSIGKCSVANGPTDGLAD
jgi:hypothetical protein